MKRMRTAIMAFFVVLVTGLLVTGCNNAASPDTNSVTKDPAQGKVLILQAYGNGIVDANGNASVSDTSNPPPSGASNSFVELYNVSDADINLSGISLYYANGKSGANVTQDWLWKSIPLSGTIHAGGSFLIVGAKYIDSSPLPSYEVPSGDINDNNLILNRRGFKVALIRGSAALAVQNPFTAGSNGKPVAGYIDMVGAVNNPPADTIFGYEAAPARCSASEAVRRAWPLLDLDDNSTDFESVRYATISGADLEANAPHTATMSAWNPCPPPPDIAGVDYKTLVLNEINGNDKYVEIYNSGDNPIPLYNVRLQRNGGPSAGSEWIGRASAYIPGKEYRLILFNGYAADLADNSAYTGWTVNSGISSGQVLQVALIDPYGRTLDQFTRGDNPLPSLGTSFTSTQTQDTVNSYSRMYDGPSGEPGTWVYAAKSAGLVNGSKVKDIANPGYLTHTRLDPPAISALTKDRTSVGTGNTVKVSATITTTTTTTPPVSTISSVVFNWTINGVSQSPLTPATTPVTTTSGTSGNVYTWTIPAQSVANTVVTYYVSATNSRNETAVSDTKNYVVTNLVLNEVNGVPGQKWFELYNNGTSAINLNGVTAWYNSGKGYQLTWTGQSTDSIPGKGWFVVTSTMQSQGLSPNNANVQLQLRDLNNNELDTYQKPAGVDTNIDPPSKYSGLYNLDHARIPDGTGPWYYLLGNSTGTQGATNGSLPTSWIIFGDEIHAPPPPAGSSKLMILQANTFGNYNSNTNSGFYRSLVELYNNTNSEINLDTGNYYLHYGNYGYVAGSTASTANSTDPDTFNWAPPIKLTGKIPPQCSYLIVDNSTPPTPGTNVPVTPSSGRAALPVADQTANMVLGKNDFTVAIIKWQSGTPGTLTGNPYNTTGYVDIDMLGVNGSVSNNAYSEGTFAAQSRPQGPRRISLTDTDNNGADFKQADFRGVSGNNGTPDANLYKIWPRNKGQGAWDPITGIPAINPTPNN